MLHICYQYLTTSIFPRAEGDDFEDVLDEELVIPEGQTMVTFPVAILDDGVSEPEESFMAVLSDPSDGASLRPGAESAEVQIPMGGELQDLTDKSFTS